MLILSKNSYSLEHGLCGSICSENRLVLGNAIVFLFASMCSLIVMLSSCMQVPVAYADGADASDEAAFKIGYDVDTSVHTKNDTVLFCMNNMRHWPHDATGITAPLYRIADLRETVESAGCDWNTFRSRLQYILYAGYPFNGFGLYEIVDDTVSLTETEYTALLDAPDWVRSDFPDSIGSTVFTYDDYKSNDSEKISRLQRFIMEASAYYGKTLPSGHAYSELTTSPFYYAAFFLIGSTDDPLKAVSQYAPQTNKVTEAQAYDATSYAVWKLMYDSGIADNNISDISHNFLADMLYEKSLSAPVMPDSEPFGNGMSIIGDGVFHETEDGVWETGRMCVDSPSGYDTVSLSLTGNDNDNVKIVDMNGNVISSVGTQDGCWFKLVSFGKPSDSITVNASGPITWLSSLKMYSPVGNPVASDGKRFQNMVGAEYDSVSAEVSLPINVDERKTLDDDTSGENADYEGNDSDNVNGTSDGDQIGKDTVAADDDDDNGLSSGSDGNSDVAHISQTGDSAVHALIALLIVGMISVILLGVRERRLR